MRLPQNRLSHGTPGKVKFLTKFGIVPKILKNRDFMKRMGGKDATNAILANLRSKIFKIFWRSMSSDPPYIGPKKFSAQKIFCPNFSLKINLTTWKHCPRKILIIHLGSIHKIIAVHCVVSNHIVQINSFQCD